jgi:hypothetical protein
VLTRWSAIHEQTRSSAVANRTGEPVERAQILLAYREDPSFFAVGRALDLHHQTVQRCVERAVFQRFDCVVMPCSAVKPVVSLRLLLARS